jgi:metal-sulfur cluster biosynthetic enzyme
MVSFASLRMTCCFEGRADMTSPTPQPEPTVQSPETIRKALRAVKDPELNLNIVDIGLVYDIESSDEGDVKVKMTLTSPGCPAGGEIIEDVRRVTGDLEGVRNVEVELVWDPYWTPERMDPRVRAFLGF